MARKTEKKQQSKVSSELKKAIWQYGTGKIVQAFTKTKVTKAECNIKLNSLSFAIKVAQDSRELRNGSSLHAGFYDLILFFPVSSFILIWDRCV